ncbi:p40 [Palpita vitrealis nucleopolyhedrovirus]|uniref:P40 n=1 Tax=Palpita vitrealis nucleopolyhedrovirus TaxID=2951960 RepID=A0AAE9LNK1_9ABAC|nr:p40 [Palpita vitrealis nucleopolyhedrovirus]
MSAIALYLEINKLRLKIDEPMQLAIWPQLFPLLCDNYQSVELNTDAVINFMMHVARASQNIVLNNNAAIASQYAAGNANQTPVMTSMAQPVARPVINLFAQANANTVEQPSEELINMRRYRNAARKLLHHYSLNSTHSTEFKVSDVIMTMIFLLRSEKYNTLFKLLESTFDNYTCRPHMAQTQMDTLLDSVRSLLEMPTSTVDSNTIDVMRSSFARCFNSPVMRYAKIALLQNVSLQRDKRTTLEELLIERGEKIQTLQPQQYINSGTGIPFCDDADFLNKLLKHIDPYPLSRMYYNAANTMFYTTMENYAVSNCKFNIEDYNNIFKVMDNIRKYNNKTTNDHDELSIYLGVQSSNNTKRKKY